MAATIRKIRHSLYLGFIRLITGLLPAASHLAFIGAGSSAQLGRHIAALAPRKVLIVTDASEDDAAASEES